MTKNETLKNKIKEENVELLCEKFIKKVAMSKDYDYIIFVARRCFNVYKVYDFINKIEYNSTVYSSRAIDIIGDKFFEKRVLICDDILIHGKALYNLKKRIQKYNPKNIDVKVIIQKYDSYDVANSIFNLDAKCEKLSTEYQWKEESQEIMKLAQRIPKANVSYILDGNIIIDQDSSYTIEKIISENNFRNNYVNITIDNSHYVFPKENKYSDLIDFRVIRIYENRRIDNSDKEGKSLSIVPYIHFKPLNSDEINYIWNEICNVVKKIFCNIEELSVILEGFKNNADKFMAITAIFSVLAWKNELNSFSSFEIDWDYLNFDKNYIDNFSKYFVKPIFEQNIYANLDLNQIKIIDKPIQLVDNKYEEILNQTSLWYNRWFDIKPDENSNYTELLKFINSVINQYIQFMSDFEESEFCEFIVKNNKDCSSEQCLDYCYNGMSFTVFVDFLTEFTKNKFTICVDNISNVDIRNVVIAYSLNKLDLGYISLNTDVSNNYIGYYSFKTGEASWALIFDNHQEVFWPLVKAFDFSQKLKNTFLFKDGCTEYFEQIYEAYIQSDLNKTVPVGYLKSVLHLFEIGVPFDVHVYDKYKFSYKDEEQSNFATTLFEIIKSVTKDYIDKRRN